MTIQTIKVSRSQLEKMVGVYEGEVESVNDSLSTKCTLQIFDHFADCHSVSSAIEKIQKFRINILRADIQVLNLLTNTFILHAMYTLNPTLLLVLKV